MANLIQNSLNNKFIRVYDSWLDKTTNFYITKCEEKEGELILKGIDNNKVVVPAECVAKLLTTGFANYEYYCDRCLCYFQYNIR